MSQNIIHDGLCLGRLYMIVFLFFFFVVASYLPNFVKQAHVNRHSEEFSSEQLDVHILVSGKVGHK